MLSVYELWSLVAKGHFHTLFMTLRAVGRIDVNIELNIDIVDC